MNFSLSFKSPRTNVFQGICFIGVIRLIIPWWIPSSFCKSSDGNSLVRMAIAPAWEYCPAATAKTFPGPPGPPPGAAILACPCVLPECEPRATPLSTRSILAVRRVNWLPLFPFSFVPHGRPPPFPTVCDSLRLFFVYPMITQENTYSKNCGEEDESSHPTHPRGPALKKKSLLLKQKYFFF